MADYVKAFNGSFPAASEIEFPVPRYMDANPKTAVECMMEKMECHFAAEEFRKKHLPKAQAAWNRMIDLVEIGVKREPMERIYHMDNVRQLGMETYCRMIGLRIEWELTVDPIVRMQAAL